MRFDRYTLEVPDGVGVGTELPVFDLADKWIQFANVAPGTRLSVEGTIDETTWRTLFVQEPGRSAVEFVVVDGLYAVAHAVKSIRVRRLAGSGSVVATISGRMPPR